MKKLDEESIIKIIQGKLGNKKFVSEDVEIFNLGKTKIVSKMDTLVESTDIPPQMKLRNAARKSIVACVSDFAAKGVCPQYGIISINLPNSITRSKIDQISNGFKSACDEYGIKILGGDTNAGKEFVFNVCIFGKSDSIIRRNGSKKGDLVFVTGPFGYTSAGLSILLEKKKIHGKFAKKAIDSVLYPKAKLRFGLKNKKYFSSSMDSSDGLSTTLNELSKQSKTKFIINNIPAKKELEDYANSQKTDLKKLVFHGGEEYDFVFTINPKYRTIILKNAKLLGTEIIEVGYVTNGSGVYIVENDKLVKLKDLGWKHFR
ncbi:MAG: thiamine-phosphate kinase [Nitrosopumilus sp.]|uniref:thiamine-phosphate kinase n=1 Tax=Nitrosopumilus sp. TaxID=2024843 RepID=UPI00247ED7CA|nr:thiamine-phosphate kinase [Nitrosopumilus sp.]MCV0392848.1 thiamine-phosphate kinase [Nitrosopumilus sp.]